MFSFFSLFSLYISGGNQHIVYAMSIKVELPNNQARQLRDDWVTRLIGLREEVHELETAIASIDAQLSGALAGVVTGEPTTRKRQKGPNYRAICSFLKNVGVNGATVAEISKNAHVPVSSTVYLLKTNEDTFAKGQGGLWRIKPNAPNL